MRDVYQSVTDQIVEHLQTGVRPWIKPWSTAHLEGRVSLPLRHNGEPYRGVNILALWLQGLAKGYASARWMTFKQALDLGGHVRKGEKGSLSVYTDTLLRPGEDEGDDPTAIRFMKGYTVFNVDQIDGLPEAYYTRAEPPPLIAHRIETAECFVTAARADIRFGGNSAFYSSGSDHIQLPPFETFHDAEGYYSTLLHELTHWTRHPSRLDRSFGRKRWGDEGYAMEELVAELGAAFLCATLHVTPEIREDHASYLDSWLTVLKRDTRAIFTAAGHAQRAADFLHAFSAPQERRPAA